MLAMSSQMAVWLTVIAYIIIQSSDAITVPYVPHKRYSKPGDINLAGFFPLHNYSPTGVCGSRIRNLGPFQRMEAMVEAIDRVNKNKVLGNLTLGYVIVDDCQKPNTAMSLALELLNSVPQSDVCQRNATEERNTTDMSTGNNSTIDGLVGVIGADFSSMSVHLASILAVYKMPQISYFATAEELSDKGTFPYFLRVAMPNSFQMGAISAVVSEFNWTYVSLFYIEGSYGAMYKLLKDDLEKKGVCFGYVKEVKKSFVLEDYYKMALALHSGTYVRAKAVILYVFSTQAQLLWRAIHDLGLKGDFVWVGGDGFGEQLPHYRGLEHIASGAITVSFSSEALPQVKKRVQGYSRGTAQNPWFDEVLDYQFCEEKKLNTSECNKYTSFKNDSSYKGHQMESLVTDTVNLYTSAIKLTNCTQEFHQLNHIRECLRERLFNELRSIKFKGYAGTIQFDKNGDGLTSYRVLNLQKTGIGYEIVPIGHYKTFTKKLVLEQPVQWRVTSSNHRAPTSVCSEHCKANQGHVRDTFDPDCCWNCKDCNKKQIVERSRENANQQICQDCLDFFKPSKRNVSLCDRIAPEHFSWNDHIIYGPAATAFAGLLFTLFAIAFLIRYNNHIVVRASSRELITIMMIGVTLSYVFVLVLLMKPTNITCLASRLGNDICFSIIYGPLLIRLTRIQRIFQHKDVAKLKFVSPASQVVMCCIIFLVHSVVLITWYSIEPIVAKETLTSLLTSEIVCEGPVGALLFSIIYIGILLFTCGVYAFLTRNVPDNYNETKIICFCVFTTLIMWLVAVPANFIDIKYRYKVIFQTCGLICNAVVMTMCLFVSKVYAVHYSKKNETTAKNSQTQISTVQTKL